MKRLLLTLFLFFSFFSLWSQNPVNLGLKFGINSSSLITDFDEFFDQSEINKFFAGAFVRVNFGNIYFQPEVYFNTKGGILSSVNSTTTQLPNLSELFSYQTIDIPILLGINIIKKPAFNLRVHAGPVLSYVTSEPLISDLKDLNIDELKDNYIGIQAGVGFDLWFVTIDARVENSFDIFINDSNYKAANRVYLLSAGIKLF
jgi:hypothetical protein